ncbi:uncharacterized protein LOC130621994 [Hydractinia symbiolongicarpus]|uniref:uncharacterized protein LOC130621994 n=1 Tax=Hydractinia symbiolongicarpus TaxID=13093 RepID=UPI0025509667|nr:uncharacterized protein LOC130621994 [Hydractinia symbiolongicarpus]
MDGEAINASTDKMMKSMGLTALGDILAVRAYTKHGKAKLSDCEKDKVKAELAAAIRNGHAMEKPNKLSFTVNVGSQNFNERLKKYSYVKCTGGSRKLSLPGDITMSGIKEQLHKTFFPKDNNPVLGSLSLFETYLGSFSGDKLSDDLTLESYVEEHNLKHIRIYLKIKKKSILSSLFTKLKSNIFEDDQDDDVLFESPFNTHKVANINLVGDEDNNRPILLGSSVERKRLRDEIDEAYNTSLEADKKKSDGKNENKQLQSFLNETKEIEDTVAVKERRLIDIMNIRKNRVMPEPDLSEAHVTISIRHPVIGNKARLFHDTAKFTQVYDWVGGLSLQPEHFTLINFDRHKVSPDEKVFSGIFNVNEEETPTPMTPGGTVGFRGYATITVSDDDDVVPPPVAEQKNYVNDNLVENRNLQSEMLLEYKSGESKKKFDSLQDFCANELSKLNNSTLYFDISRDNVYQELIDIYKKRGTISHKATFRFSGEEAYGDGVTKDCYAEFYKKLFEKMDGVMEKVPLDDCVDEEELEIIGSIVNHAFIQYAIFPLQLCKSTVKKLLFDRVDKQQLLCSFLNFVKPYETETILRFSKEEETSDQPIVDVLYSYNVFDKPKTNNVLALCLKAANTALINRPYLPMKYIVKGMGSFWQKLSESMIDSLYSTCTPTAESLIEQIFFNETCPQGRIISTYLNRYIRSCTKSELLLLVGFITGSSSLLPTSSIKVEFVDQNPKCLYPLAKTCFKILILPRQFQSFTQFQTSLNVHFNSNDHWSVYDGLSILD